jgi:hypothetical protein
MTVEEIEEVHNPTLEATKHASHPNDPAAAIKRLDPKQLAFVVAQVKASGNEAFQAKRYRGKCTACPACMRAGRTALMIREMLASVRDYMHRVCAEAIRRYDEAVAGAPKDATLLGNRSAAYLALGLYREAEEDAAGSTELDASWAKGHFRSLCHPTCFLRTCPHGGMVCTYGPGPDACHIFVRRRRLGCAKMALGEWASAAQALATGLGLAPGSKDMVSSPCHQRSTW